MVVKSHIWGSPWLYLREWHNMTLGIEWSRKFNPSPTFNQYDWRTWRSEEIGYDLLNALWEESFRIERLMLESAREIDVGEIQAPEVTFREKRGY